MSKDAVLQNLTEQMLLLVRQIREHLYPLAPDDQVREWPLCVDNYGDIVCGDGACPLQAESSIMMVLDGDNFTLDDLHHQISLHISARNDLEENQ